MFTLKTLKNWIHTRAKKIELDISTYKKDILCLIFVTQCPYFFQDRQKVILTRFFISHGEVREKERDFKSLNGRHGRPKCLAVMSDG